MGKGGGGAEGAGGVEVHQKTRDTATETANSGEEFLWPGARLAWKFEGNGGGDSGAFIGQSREGDHGA